jgi:FkbM family methyltransferase
MTYAQFGDDVFLLAQYPKGYQGYAVEVGAFDGFTRSQTLLMEQSGWTCLCIEPNPGPAKTLRKNRPFVIEAACGPENIEEADFHIHHDNPEAHSGLRVVPHHVWRPKPGAKFSTIKVRVRTLDSCLEEFGFKKLDVMAIDTEGTELDVLKGADLARWSPRFIVAESWDLDTPITPYLAESGYKWLRRQGVNMFYEREVG